MYKTPAKKILLYCNFSSADYSGAERIQWLNDVLRISRQDQATALDVFVCRDKSPESGNAGLLHGTSFTGPESNDALATLKSIQERIFPFDIIFMYGRNPELQEAARTCHLPVVSFFKAPYPLDGWIVDSKHHQTALTVSIDDDGEDGYHGRSDMMNVIPSFARYYNRFSPYTGGFAEAVYDRNIRKVLIPVFSDYRRFTNHVTDHATDCIADTDDIRDPLNAWLESILPFAPELLYLVVPMENMGNEMASVSSPGDASYIRWLSPSDGRNQILSLIDKADGVLALDIRAAVLPMLMGKWTCCLPGISDMSEQWPSFTDWLADGAQKARINCSRCFQRQRFILNCCIVPKTDWALQSISESVVSEMMPPITSHDNIKDSLRPDYSTEERGATQRSIWRRKLKKLWRNPYRYCADSRYTFLRLLKLVFAYKRTHW